MSYCASGDRFGASVTNLRRLIQPVTSLFFEVRTCLVTCRAGGTFNTAYDNLSTGISFATFIPMNTEVLGIVEWTFVEPVIKSVKADFLGDSCRILTKKSGNILEGYPFIKRLLNVLTVIKC